MISVAAGFPFADRFGRLLTLTRLYTFLTSLLQQKRAYYCFCSSTRLAAIRKELQKAGDNSTYDRHCLDLTTEEVQERLAKGEKSVVRFKVCDEPGRLPFAR